MQLSSSAFSGGSASPRRSTCDGEDLSLTVDWEAAPPATRSFVRLCDDPDVPAGKWHSCSEVEREARKYVIAEATLIGIYQR